MTGYGNVGYNTRRGILAALPLGGKIAYRMFQIGANSSKAEKNTVKLCRKSKWHSQYSTHESNVTTLDR